MEDQEIIRLYWNREEEAIVQSQYKYEHYLQKIANNILYDTEDSEECVNDTWLNAWEAIPPTWPKILAAFLGSITRNLSLDRYRKGHAIKRGSGEMPFIFDELKDCVTKNRVEEHLDLLAVGEAINRFLATLNKEQRMVFVRRYWYMESTSEVAKRFAIRESKVKSSLFRTRKKLKAYLEEEGFII